MIHGVAVSRVTGWPSKQKMKRCSNNLQRIQLILSPHTHCAQQRQASARISSRNERIPEESQPKEVEHPFACINTGCQLASGLHILLAAAQLRVIFTLAVEYRLPGCSLAHQQNGLNRFNTHPP
jgi:hypothetical protein